MVSQTVAGQFPREADRQRTFSKPSAAARMPEEYYGFSSRSAFTFFSSLNPPTVSALEGSLIIKQATVLAPS